jgi:hypothetical protein
MADPNATPEMMIPNASTVNAATNASEVKEVAFLR